MNQPLLASYFSFAATSPPSAFIELKRVGALIWIRLWLKGTLWLVSSSIQTTETFSTSAIRLFHFLIIHVLMSSTFNFLQELFFYIYNLFNWYQRPTFQPVSAFDVPFSLSLIISSFWFKLRDMWLFLSLEHFEVIIGLLIGLISILCLRE